MFSSSPSNTPGRVASPAFPQSPPNKPSTPDYSAFASLQQSYSSSRPQSYSSPKPVFSLPQPALPQQSTAARHTHSASVDDDFGTFSSAVSTNTVVQLTNSSNIVITIESDQRAGSAVSLTAKFTNKLPVQIDEITFQMAVPRVHSHPPFPSTITPSSTYRSFSL